MKKFTLRFKDSAVVAIAELSEKDAPQTCKAFWETLPIEHEAVHSSWSGECILVVPCGVDASGIAPPENETIFVGPGEIALFTPVQELLVFYGRGQPRWRSGPTASTIFAKIVDGLEAFATECKKMVRHGSRTVLIQRKE